MSIDLNKLKSMTNEQLTDVARQVNAPFNSKSNKEALIENIINKVMEQSLNPNKNQAEEPKVKEPVFLTEDELEKVFAPIKEKYKAFSTIYDSESKSVIMRYNDGRYRHSETMSLSCPLAKFTRKAHEIAKGPLVLRGMKTEEWGKLGGINPNNAYAETVLAG